MFKAYPMDDVYWKENLFCGEKTKVRLFRFDPPLNTQHEMLGYALVGCFSKKFRSGTEFFSCFLDGSGRAKVPFHRIDGVVDFADALKSIGYELCEPPKEQTIEEWLVKIGGTPTRDGCYEFRSSRMLWVVKRDENPCGRSWVLLGSVRPHQLNTKEEIAAALKALGVEIKEG